MKILSLTFAFLSTCFAFFALGYAMRPSSPRPNLAAQAVLAAEPDSKCTDLYAGAGSDATYSSVCRLPNKQVVYATVDLRAGFAARSLSGGGAPTAQVQPPAPPAPAPQAPAQGSAAQ